MDIYTGKHFKIVFTDWCQDFLGQCIVSGTKEKLSDMTSEEWIELGTIEKELERVCTKLFGATYYNFCCLMNNAFRDNETPHVHFWFFPRYKDEVKIFGKRFIDKHYGYNFWKWNRSRFKKQKDIFTNDERLKICEMIKKELKLKNK